MGIWFWFVLTFAIFAFIILVRKWHDQAILYTLAIGFAINANIFNAFSTPISWGPIVFSIDSILYTGFMFCVIVCAHEYGTRNAKILTLSTIAAILLSAVIEFLAKTSSFGFDINFLIDLSGYLFSAVGTFAAIWLMLFVFEKLKNKNLNIYLNIVICLLIASVINSSIFYAFALIKSSDIQALSYILAGSYIGKIFCIGLSLISFYICTHYYIPNNLKEKYKKQKKEEPKNLEENERQG